MSYKTLQDKINKIGKAPRGTGTAIAPSRPAFAATQAKPAAAAPELQVQFKELDEALELAAARRAKEAKKSEGLNQPYNRKK